MDINENLLQINTFTGGMNSDSSPMYLKDNQYRFALNLVLVKTDSESKGELRLVDSIERFLTDKDSENATITNLKYITSCREYAILIYEIQVDGYTKWCIGVFTEHSQTITRVFGPCDEALGDTLSCVTRYETEKSIKLYIADGIHLILSINVAKFFTIGNDLRLRLIPETPLFTTIDQISNNYNILLSLPQVGISSSTGRIIGPKVQYAYVLYKENGGKTTMSPLSSTITLYDTSTGHNEGFAVGESSGVAIDIAINIAQNQIADKIRLFRISYRASGQDPNIDIVYDDTYSSDSFTFTDIGGEKRSISFAEFTEYQTLDVKPKIIETKDNYLFAGNIQYSQDEVDAEFADFPMDSISILPVQGNLYTLDLNLNVYDGSYKKTLIPGEIYKYGIIIYDKHGRKTTVKQFDTIEVSIDPLLAIRNDGNTDVTLRYSCMPVCLELNFRNISQDWKNKISKIELVRCLKTITNSKVLDYGIIGSPCVSDNPNYLFLSHYITLDILQNHHPTPVQTGENSYNVATNDNAVNDIFIYACPQHIYDQSFLSKIKSIRNTLELKLDYIYTPNARTTIISKDDASNLHFFSDFNYAAYNDSKIYVKEYGFVGTDNHFYGGIPIMDLGENVEDLTMNGCWAGCDDSVFCNRDIPSSTTGYPYPSGNGYGCFIHPCLMVCEQFDDSVRNRTSARIKNIEETNYISPYDFLNNSSQQNITFKGKTTGYVNIGDYTFCNFSSSKIFNEGDPDTNNTFRKSFGLDPQYIHEDETGHLTPQEWWAESYPLTPHNSWWHHKYPDIQSGGKYLVILTKDIADDFGFTDTINPCAVNTYIAKLINTAAYQSNDDVYYSTGDIYTPDLFNNLQYSFSGDGYFNIFLFLYLHALEDSTAHPISYPVAYAIPIISRIDLKAVSGQIWPFRNNAQNSEFFQDQPVQMLFYKQTKSAYLYNGAYSMDNIAVPYAYVERSSVDSNKNDNRVLYSAKKENGEGIDSWLTFKTNDFIDVDTRFGLITGLKLFADRLLFWQEHAFGMLSVNERQMSQSSDGTQIVLGTGGVLDRFDYVSTLYGLKLEHLNCICNSNSAVYWWDSYRKQILQYAPSKNQYSSKYLIHLMLIDKSINSLVNNTLLSEADGESTNPSIHYDINNRNVLFSLFNRDSLIYSEDFDVFTSVLDYVFKGNTTIDGKSYFVGEQNKVETYLNEDPLHLIILKYTFYPSVIFYVNKLYQYNKVFDNTTYYGDILDNNNKDYLWFTYSTPSRQFGKSNGNDITDREMEYRMAIPRQLKLNGDEYEWGGRLRGKYLETKIWVAGPQQNFSLQYVITKFRISYV